MINLSFDFVRYAWRSLALTSEAGINRSIWHWHPDSSVRHTLIEFMHVLLITRIKKDPLTEH